MWFKNLRLYRLTSPFTLSAEELHERLAAEAFRPCGSLETATMGWVPPLGRRATEYTHAAAGAVLIAARKEERILPGSVVNDMLAEKIEAIEDAEGRPVRRKERQNLKDEIIHQLLPRAFTKSSVTHAYIVPRSGWLVVNASSAKKAEELLTLLRRALGSLPAAPPRVQSVPSVMMTAWIAGQQSVPSGVELGDEGELKEPGEEGGVVRVKRLNLLSDEIQTHLDAGRRVVKLALQFEERIRFVLDEELAIKRLGFEDTVLDELDGVESDDELAQFDAQFALMTLELGRLLPQVLDWFGGEESPASAA